MSFNARIPKPYDQLPDKDKEKIRAFVRQVALEAAEVEIQRIARIMLDIYMKMACVMLHDMPDGWGEKRLRMFLGNHKRVSQGNSSLSRETNSSSTSTGVWRRYLRRTDSRRISLTRYLVRWR